MKGQHAPHRRQAPPKASPGAPVASPSPGIRPAATPAGRSSLLLPPSAGVVFATYSAAAEPLLDYLGTAVVEQIDRLFAKPVQVRAISASASSATGSSTTTTCATRTTAACCTCSMPPSASTGRSLSDQHRNSKKHAIELRPVRRNSGACRQRWPTREWVGRPAREGLGLDVEAEVVGAERLDARGDGSQLRQTRAVPCFLIGKLAAAAGGIVG